LTSASLRSQGTVDELAPDLLGLHQAGRPQHLETLDDRLS
jgi:hypothetical protein